MIGRLHHVVIDCPEPAALAEFYSELIGLPVTYRSPDWVVIAENDTSSGMRSSSPPIISHPSGATPSGRSSSTSMSWSTIWPPRTNG